MNLWLFNKISKIIKELRYKIINYLKTQLHILMFHFKVTHTSQIEVIIK